MKISENIARIPTAPYTILISVSHKLGKFRTLSSMASMGNMGAPIAWIREYTN